MVRKTRVQSQVESYQKLFKKWYLIPPCLTLSIIRYVSRVKWSNPGKGVAPFPTPRFSSYWKGSLWVALDYSRRLYFYLFCLYVMVTELITVVVANIISFKSVKFGLKSCRRFYMEWFANFICIGIFWSFKKKFSCALSFISVFVTLATSLIIFCFICRFNLIFCVVCLFIFFFFVFLRQVDNSLICCIHFQSLKFLYNHCLIILMSNLFHYCVHFKRYSFLSLDISNYRIFDIIFFSVY